MKELNQCCTHKRLFNILFVFYGFYDLDFLEWRRTWSGWSAWPWASYKHIETWIIRKSDKCWLSNKKYTFYNLSWVRLNCNRILLIRKTGFNMIIKSYWYTKWILYNRVGKTCMLDCNYWLEIVCPSAID